MQLHDGRDHHMPAHRSRRAARTIASGSDSYDTEIGPDPGFARVSGGPCDVFFATEPVQSREEPVEPHGSSEPPISRRDPNSTLVVLRRVPELGKQFVNARG